MKEIVQKLLFKNQFKIHRKLGEGRTCNIFLGQSRGSSQLLALKTPKLRYLYNGNVLGALKNEAELWLSLGKHRNILTAKDFQYINNVPVLLLDYCQSSNNAASLYEHILRQQESLSIYDPVEWGLQICQGMIFLNENGVLSHGDLNPKNILVSEDGVLKICDFGAAIRSDEHRFVYQINGDYLIIDDTIIERSLKYQASTFITTDGYSSPETTAGKISDQKSDIYSFGITFWQLLTGTLQFPSKGNLYKPESAKSRLDSNTFIALKALVDRCILKEPIKRWSGFIELSMALKNIKKNSASCKI